MHSTVCNSMDCRIKGKIKLFIPTSKSLSVARVCVPTLEKPYHGTSIAYLIRLVTSHLTAFVA